MRQSASGRRCFTPADHNVRLHLNAALLCSIGFAILFLLSPQGHFNQPLSRHVGTAENLMRGNYYAQFLLRWIQGEILSASCPTTSGQITSRISKSSTAGSRESTAKELHSLAFERRDNHEGESHPLGCDSQIKCCELTRSTQHAVRRESDLIPACTSVFCSCCHAGVRRRLFTRHRRLSRLCVFVFCPPARFCILQFERECWNKRERTHVEFYLVQVALNQSLELPGNSSGPTPLHLLAISLLLVECIFCLG